MRMMLWGLALLGVCSCLNARAETIGLKNGDEIVGEIITRDSSTVIIKEYDSGRTRRVMRTSIDYISLNGAPDPDASKRRADLKGPAKVEAKEVAKTEEGKEGDKPKTEGDKKEGAPKETEKKEGEVKKEGDKPTEKKEGEKKETEAKKDGETKKDGEVKKEGETKKDGEVKKEGDAKPAPTTDKPKEGEKTAETKTEEKKEGEVIVKPKRKRLLQGEVAPKEEPQQ